MKRIFDIMASGLGLVCLSPLFAIDGASIRPVATKKSSIEISLEEARNGQIAGPFNSVEDLMADLLG